MDVEETIKFILESQSRMQDRMQARQEAREREDEEQARKTALWRTEMEERSARVAAEQAIQAETLTQTNEILNRLAETHVRDEEKNRRQHDEFHERINILIKMMDEQVRKRRNGE